MLGHNINPTEMAAIEAIGREIAEITHGVFHGRERISKNPWMGYLETPWESEDFCERIEICKQQGGAIRIVSDC